MKKLLLTILIILLLVLIYIIGFKGLKIGPFRIDSIYEIKNSSNKLDEDLAKATEVTLKTYPEAKASLDTAVANLKSTKDKYQLKIASMSDSSSLGYTQLDNYEKEFLWTNIGIYAKNEKVKLALDITEVQESEYYDLNFTVVGKYSDVADFIYDLENDDKLNFKIENFIMNPYSATETTTVTTPSGQTSNTDKPYEASKQTTISAGTQTTSEVSIPTTQSNTIENSTTTITTKKNEKSSNSNSTTSIMNSPDRVQATFVVKKVNINMN